MNGWQLGVEKVESALYCGGGGDGGGGDDDDGGDDGSDGEY